VRVVEGQRYRHWRPFLAMDGSGGSKFMGHLSPWGWKLSLCDWYLLQHRFSGVVYFESQCLIAANAEDCLRAFRLFRLSCSCS
jgi:hypothetical protein